MSKIFHGLMFRIFVLGIIIPILFVAINQLNSDTMFVYSNADRTFVYVSNGDDGDITVMELNLNSGNLKLVEKVPAGPNVMHMALSPDHHFLYASIRSEPFSVISYSINSETGKLTQLSKESLPDNMVYISVDKTGRFLLSVSYSGSKIAVNPIASNGVVQPEPIQLISTELKPHSILVDQSNRFIYVPHLGNDKIRKFLFDESTGNLKPNNPDFVYSKNGSGPRHFDFSPNNNFVYVSNELDGTVYAYEMNNKTGILTEIQRISVFPPPNMTVESSTTLGRNDVKDVSDGVDTAIKVADIHITSDGKWLYVSERATNTITAFSVDSASGNLTYIGNYNTEKIPRGINIDPDGNFVIAAGQKSDHVSVYAINRQSGELKLLDRYESGKGPNWIEIVESK
ncbi:MAG: beta-propeller fold lactonase family protein [Nitrososphaeraceae archaeon]|nr:beta-propeller fold lactonase family protein [Nitrososphaeraceae archaeon]